MFTLLLAALLSACGEDFLDRSPQSEVDVPNFYRTAADINSAVNAAYGALQKNEQYGSDFLVLMEYRSDNAVDNDPSANAGIRYDIDRLREIPTNSVLSGAWGSLYNGIYRCNEILARIDDIAMEETLKNRYRGEARFIRALSYFNLVRLWGPVPLVRTPITTQESQRTQRDDVSQVYAAIEEDLLLAARDLPPSYPPAEAGRATSGAAKALLGKVYLTEKKHSEARAILKEVIDAKTYSLLPNLADVFSVANKNNAEVVFAVKYRKGGVGEGHGLYFGTVALDPVDPSLKSAYAPADTVRRRLLDLVTLSGTQKVVRKYFDQLSGANDVGNDFIVLRYADVLLMYAEALNEEGYQGGGEAFTALNAVRTRAKLGPLTAAELPDQVGFRAAVLNERRLELALENHRWFDLLRTGTALPALQSVGIAVPDTRLLYPVPQSEIDIMDNPTGFPQNPGYN
jgi:hypothetical protein